MRFFFALIYTLTVLTVANANEMAQEQGIEEELAPVSGTMRKPPFQQESLLVRRFTVSTQKYPWPCSPPDYCPKIRCAYGSQ